MVKKKKFSKITLSTSSKDGRVISIARQIIEILSSLEVEISHDKSLLSLNKSKNSKLLSTKEIVTSSDLLIAIGGDGTMLNCSRIYGSKDVSLLGINLGKLGFLSDIAPDDVTTSLVEVINGKYLTDNRFFLEASIKDDKESFIALNEIVIHSGSIAQMIEFEIYINDSFVYRQKADGVIINTPTGSTAYSLSGGGPIVHPEVGAITLLPMFPQSLSSSSLIVKDSSLIRVVLIQSGSSCQVSFDSQDKIRLRMYVAHRAGLKNASTIHVEVLGEEDWRKYLKLGRPAFAGVWGDELKLAGIKPDVPVTDKMGQALEQQLDHVRKRPEEIFITFMPRGVGLTALSNDERHITQARRRFMLLGQTLAGMQVWDVRRCLQAARTLPGFDRSSIELWGRGGMASVVTLASLYEPSIGQLNLSGYPQNDKEQPDSLNVSRIVTPKQILGLAAMRAKVNLLDQKSD